MAYCRQQGTTSNGRTMRRQIPNALVIGLKHGQSAFSILGQSVELKIAETELRGMAGAALIVKVDLQKYTSMDYEKSDEMLWIK